MVMGKVVRIAGRVIATLALVAGLVVAWTLWRSEAHLRAFRLPPRFAVAIPTDAASVARGKHVAVTRGCIGCHGSTLRGEVHDSPWYDYGREVSADLPALLRTGGPGSIEAAVRHGIGHDGRALFSMPAYSFARLDDGDMAAVIAFIAAQPQAPATGLPRGYLGWKPRWDMARGEDFAVPHFIARVPPLRHVGDPRPGVARGEYLALTTCTECHGFGLRGDNPFDTSPHRPPDLAMARGYQQADFATLMRTGIPPGGRDLGLMKHVAIDRFSHWTPAEVDALHAYLTILGINQKTNR